MDNSLMVALQNQRILQERLDVTANNLANAATTGFKADGLLFEQLVKRPAQSEALPHDVRFVADAGLMRDMSQGPIMRTGSPLDVAIEGDGFFIVQGPNGMAYTRDGSFTVSQDGTLVTKDGRPVLSQTGSPVVFDSQGGNPTIDADGSVRVEGVEAGQIGMAKFADPSALRKIGDNLYTAAGQTAQSADDSRMVQFALENSNVRPVIELTRLIEISRAYESAARIVKNGDDMRKETIDRMGRAA